MCTCVSWNPPTVATVSRSSRLYIRWLGTASPGGPMLLLLSFRGVVSLWTPTFALEDAMPYCRGYPGLLIRSNGAHTGFVSGISGRRQESVHLLCPGPAGGGRWDSGNSGDRDRTADMCPTKFRGQTTRGPDAADETQTKRLEAGASACSVSS